MCCVGTFVQEFRAEGRSALASPVSWAALALTVVIVLRHRVNIERLLKGEERKI